MVTSMQNFAHVLRIVTLVGTNVSNESNKFYTCLVCIMMHWKETLPSEGGKCCSVFNNRK